MYPLLTQTRRRKLTKSKASEFSLAYTSVTQRKPKGLKVGSGVQNESGVSIRDSKVFSPPPKKHASKASAGSSAASPKKPRVVSPPKMTLFTIE